MRAEALPISNSAAWPFSPAVARAVLCMVIAVAMAAGFVATSPAASALAMQHDGAALTRLMRFMALIKAGMAMLTAGAVFWRLALPATALRLAAYITSAAAMSAGPGLIWGMVHVGWGALLLHGGLLAAVLLLWRDPAVAARLEALVAARRRRWA